MAIATFAAGCFWGVEATFAEVEGVLSTAVGYMGGNKDQPTYQEVCAGNTLHAEVVQVEYDPEQVDYEQLLNVFWQCHNPTTRNRQGPDVGTQYRSAIFFHDEMQKDVAEQSRKALDDSGVLPSPVVTEIVPAATFWKAEEYHQQYIAKKGGGSCRI
ncbi:peptide-methionine (S)-S-oxide reductase MsrA [Nitrincola sp. MINF-07-Sa-05]|uniref:peptide-methionine (S)-S-oxide reductase MsrA n=1 Tax=Nitrincola salilacus TaxID=3400273 RepID=UPI0039182E10